MAHTSEMDRMIKMTSDTQAMNEMLLQDKIEHMQRIGVLEAALEPFAQLSKEYACNDRPSDTSVTAVLNVGELLNAEKLLST